MKEVNLVVVATLICSCFAAKDLLMVDSLLTYWSLEPSEAELLGYSYDIVSLSQWQSMKTADFSAYKAIIISDPGPGIYASDLDFLAANDDWAKAITGNIIIHGTDSSNHYKNDLISNSIRFAATSDSSGSKQTGLYMSLSQYYDTDDTATVDALSYFGEFTVRGNLECYDEVHVVASSPAIQNLSDVYLSGWSCSVHEAFSAYPTAGKDGFQALAIADGVTGYGTQNFANNHFGLPYIISRGATPAGCGDGHWDQSIGEECDDGNIKDGDGCSRSCKCENGRAKGDGTCDGASESTLGLVRVPGQFRDIYYFGGAYSCVLISVLFKTLWGIVVASTKLMEPFYQMNQPDGASAAESLLSGYLASIFSLESMRNIFNKHWVMTLTAAVYCVATASLLVASKFTQIESGNRCTTPEEPLKCDLQWTVNVTAARIMQALMALSAVLILTRIFLGRKRISGISSYPGTIAWMAALLNHSDMAVAALTKIEPLAASSAIAEATSKYHYKLLHFNSSTDGMRYGIVTLRSPEKGAFTQKMEPLLKALRELPALLKQVFNAPGTPSATSASTETQEPQETASETKKPKSKLTGLIVHGVMVAVHLALFSFLLYYRLNNKSSKIFLSGPGIGPRTYLTFVAMILGFYWDSLESEVRIMTPWRRLTKANSTSRHVIEMSLHGVPITTVFRAMYHGNFFHALVATTAIVSECLTIAIVGIPYNIGVVRDVSLFSSNACLGLLGIMLFTGCLMFWWRMTNPDLPRTPNTIAKMALMLCGSKMLKHFDGLEMRYAEPRHVSERTEGRRYQLSEKDDIYGKRKMMVDVIEIEIASESNNSDSAVADIERAPRSAPGST